MKQPLFLVVLLALSLVACQDTATKQLPKDASEQADMLEARQNPARPQTQEKRIEQTDIVDARPENEALNTTLLFQDATFYTGATDYYFQDAEGTRVEIRVSNIEGETKIALPNDLLDPKAEGIPGGNPIMIGKRFEADYNESGEIIAIRRLADEDYTRRELDAFILEGYEILDSKTGDLNADGKMDAILILKSSDESQEDDMDAPKARPLLLLTRQADNSLKLAAQNDKSVLCVNCGGVFGDPYSDIAIKGNYFSIEHYGGSSWKWTKIITYKYDTEQQTWFLHKVGVEEFHSGDPDNTLTETIKSTKDFGIIAFEDYDIYDEGAIREGMSIAEVEVANGKPFLMYGYEIDNEIAGRVVSWQGGELEGMDVQFQLTEEVPQEAYFTIMGDEQFPSNTPAFLKGKAVIVKIY